MDALDALVLRVGKDDAHACLQLDVVTGTGDDPRPRIRVDAALVVLCALKFDALMRDTLRPVAHASSPVAPRQRPADPSCTSHVL